MIISDAEPAWENMNWIWMWHRKDSAIYHGNTVDLGCKSPVYKKGNFTHEAKKWLKWYLYDRISERLKFFMVCLVFCYLVSNLYEYHFSGSISFFDTHFSLRNLIFSTLTEMIKI